MLLWVVVLCGVGDCDTTVEGTEFNNLSKAYSGRAAYDGARTLITKTVEQLQQDRVLDVDSDDYLNGELNENDTRQPMHVRYVMALHNIVQKREQEKKDVIKRKKRTATAPQTGSNPGKKQRYEYASDTW